MGVDFTMEQARALSPGVSWRVLKELVSMMVSRATSRHVPQASREVYQIILSYLPQIVDEGRVSGKPWAPPENRAADEFAPEAEVDAAFPGVIGGFASEPLSLAEIAHLIRRAAPEVFYWTKADPEKMILSLKHHALALARAKREGEAFGRRWDPYLGLGLFVEKPRVESGDMGTSMYLEAMQKLRGFSVYSVGEDEKSCEWLIARDLVEAVRAWMKKNETLGEYPGFVQHVVSFEELERNSLSEE